MDEVCITYCQGCEEAVLKAKPAPTLAALTPFVSPLLNWATIGSEQVYTACVKAVWAICVVADFTDRHDNQDDPDNILPKITSFISEHLERKHNPEAEMLLYQAMSALACRSPLARDALVKSTSVVQILLDKIKLDQPADSALQAANSLAVLLLSSDARQQFLDLNGINACMAHIRTVPTPEMADSILSCLRLLLLENGDAVRTSLQQLHAISALISLCRKSQSTLVKTHIMALFALLAEEPSLRQEIADETFFPLALHTLSSATSETKLMSPASSKARLPKATTLPPLLNASPNRSNGSPIRRSSRSATPLLKEGLTGASGNNTQELCSSALLALATVLLEIEHVQQTFLSNHGYAELVDFFASVQGKLLASEVSSVTLSLCEGPHHQQLLDQGALEVLFQILEANVDEIAVAQACACLRHLLEGGEPILVLATNQHFNLEGVLRHLATTGGSRGSTAVRSEATKTLKACDKSRAPGSTIESQADRLKRLTAMIQEL
eukprot:m.187179 g.187179  ORF g.187179 m.187179 type:complete len:498 (-) comp16709_c0_seq2:1174-2667(-)